MMKNIVRGILFALCLAMVAPVWARTDDDDRPWYGNDRGLVLADLKMEVKVSAPEEIEVEIEVDKGRESDIYRDGRLVSRGEYDGAEEYVRELNTVFTHRGKAMLLELELDRPDGVRSPSRIPVQVEVKIYRDGKLVDTYKRKSVIRGNSVKHRIPYYSK